MSHQSQSLFFGITCTRQFWKDQRSATTDSLRRAQRASLLKTVTIAGSGSVGRSLLNSNYLELNTLEQLMELLTSHNAVYVGSRAFSLSTWKAYSESSMPRRQTRNLAILSHRGVDTLRTGAAITLGPSWRHAYRRSESARETHMRRGGARHTAPHRQGRDVASCWWKPERNKTKTTNVTAVVLCISVAPPLLSEMMFKIVGYCTEHTGHDITHFYGSTHRRTIVQFYVFQAH